MGINRLLPLQQMGLGRLHSQLLGRLLLKQVKHSFLRLARRSCLFRSLGLVLDNYEVAARSGFCLTRILALHLLLDRRRKVILWARNKLACQLSAFDAFALGFLAGDRSRLFSGLLVLALRKV